MRIKVIMSNGQTTNVSVKDAVVTIGRSNKSAVIIPDEALSRTHCQVELENGAFFITDPGSSNGVFIDGNRIETNKKYPVNSFNQLHLGPLECFLEDDSSDADTNPALFNPSNMSDKTGVTRRIKPEQLQKEIKKAPSRPATSRKEKTKHASPLGLLFPILLLVGAGYYFMNTREKSEFNQGSDTESQVPAPAPSYKKELKKISALDEFKLPSEYESLKNEASCNEFQNLCNNLKMKQENAEGLKQLNSEFLVFINPGQHINELRYQKIKDQPRSEELIAFDLILGSELMNKYFIRELEQIHLVLVDNQGKISRVLRFHSRKFVPGQVPRIELITALNSSMNDLNTQKFWDILGDTVAKQDLAN